MSTEYTGAGGVRKTYGPLLSPATNPEPVVSKEVMTGNVVQIELNYVFNNLPTASNPPAADALRHVIPAGALILNARRYVSTDFNSTSGTTVVDVGLYKVADGTALDADGLIDSSVAADGSNVGWEVGTVASPLNTTGVSEAAYIVVTPSVADLLAGKARVIVEYIPAAG